MPQLFTWQTVNSKEKLMGSCKMVVSKVVAIYVILKPLFIYITTAFSMILKKKKKKKLHLVGA